MRIWHYELFPYLPELQFKGQLRELVWIMRQWRDSGKTNHLLINKVMEYPKSDLYHYWSRYSMEYFFRYDKQLNDYDEEFMKFGRVYEAYESYPFIDWHNKEYLRICMSNLFEKHKYGVGKSRITDEEWQRLVDGYKQIMGEEYVI